MRIKKYILTFLIALLFLIQPVKAEKWQGSTGGTEGWGGSKCEECSWLYGSTGLGARISLYRYDGTRLEFQSSIDVVNDPNFIGETIYKTTHGQGRFYYTKLGKTVTFENVKLNTKKGRIVPISDFFDFEFKNGFGEEFEAKLINYLDEDTKGRIKNMFGITVEESNLSKYYIVVEAAMVFKNVNQNVFTYGTGYEYMQIKDEWDNDESLNGEHEYDFSDSQGNIIYSYLYNSIYVQTDPKKQDQYTGSTRYDYYNFINPDGTGLITTTPSALVYAKFSEFRKKENYNSSNYPYGLTVLWLGDDTPTPPPGDPPSGGGDTPKTCTSVCAGKSGDALLECAEDYCSSQSDVNSKATKAACITNRCKYNFTELSCSDDETIYGNNTVCSSLTSSTKKTCQIEKTTYYSYKIECATKSTVIYPTSLPTVLTATEGFEYQVNLYGNKSCTVTLDKEKWKFDYASSYTNAERSNYETALENYNKLTFTSGYSYDSSNSNIDIDIDEKISGEKVTTNKLLIAEEKYYSGSNQVIVGNSKKEKISSYNKNGDLKNKDVYIYTTDSSNGIYFHLPSVCISDKDRYTVTPGSTCENSFGPYKSYYTDINSDENKNNTKTEVVHNASGLDVDNTCNYEVSDNSNSDFSCYVTVEDAITLTDGETIFYNNSPLTFKVTSTNRKNVDIVYNISTNSGKICNSNTCIINADDMKDLTDEYLVVTGSVSDGTTTKYCDKKVFIVDIPEPPGPGPSSPKCEFIPKEEMSNIKLTIKTISDANAKYYFKQATSDTWIETKSITINKNNNNEIIGKIVMSDGTELKSESCYYEDLPIGDPPPGDEPKTCTNLYKPVEYLKIRSYCDIYWQNDTSGYSSADDCYTQCTNPDIIKKRTCKNTYKCSETAAIKQYCNISYRNDGYKTIEDCINDCSCSPSPGGIEYVYRPISITKPFPDREANWNWYGYEKYITNDEEDPTSSTSGNPEYVIELDYEKIKAIKNNTKEYNSIEGNDAYSDYVREDEDQTGAYKSKFIHVNDTSNGGFSSYFTYIDGAMTGG